jgi:hypothetical protein
VTLCRDHASMHMMYTYTWCVLRVRVEIMGSGKYENVGTAQPVLIMINPMISPRTRYIRAREGACPCVSQC